VVILLNVWCTLDVSVRTGDLAPDVQDEPAFGGKPLQSVERFEMPLTPGERRYYRQSVAEGL